MGIGSFGPLDLQAGRITSTPKTEWRNFALADAIEQALGVPVRLDTDVNAAALGEARWGAGRGLSDFLYVTVGTGIGGGALVNGRLLHGRMHPEMGHLRVPHDRVRDPFPGCCPYHGDCLEGLACGPAIAARWNHPPESLPDLHPAWDLQAHYLALALQNWACVLSPERVVIGGGAMRPAIFPQVAAELEVLLNGYMRPPDLAPPLLGARAGVLGALMLAEEAAGVNRPASA